MVQTNPMVIFGIGPDVLNEIASIYDDDYHFMAVGMDAVGILFRPINYVVTNHPEDIPNIYTRRRRVHGNTSFAIISPVKSFGVDLVLDPPYEGPSGSSSIVGTLAALAMGYKKIVLCGVPLTGLAFEGNSYEAFRPGWEYHLNKFLGKVKSTSGWTQELLGAPTEEWLKG
jgi:hypothetical protein